MYVIMEWCEDPRPEILTTHRPLSSSFLWLLFRILQGNPKKELLRGLWVSTFNGGTAYSKLGPENSAGLNHRPLQVISRGFILTYYQDPPSTLKGWGEGCQIKGM